MGIHGELVKVIDEGTSSGVFEIGGGRITSGVGAIFGCVESVVRASTGGIDDFRELSGFRDIASLMRGILELDGGLSERCSGCSGDRRGCCEENLSWIDKKNDFNHASCQLAQDESVDGVVETGGEVVDSLREKKKKKNGVFSAVPVRGQLSRGRNFEKNQRKRDGKLKKKMEMSNLDGGVVQSVPEWRKKFSTGELADSWEKRKIVENKIAVMKAEEELKRLELSASKPLRLPLTKIKTEAEEAEIEFRRREKIRSDTAKYKADTVYWQKRAEKGAVEKAVALEMEILDGQLSGKYDPFASKRTIGWAKTVKSHGSSSSGGKTVWSGSGASSKTDPSVERIPVEDRSGVLTKYRVENEKLRAEVEKLGKAGARLVRILKKKNAEGFDDGECSFDY